MLNQEKIEEIISIYNKCGGNATKAAKELCLSKTAVIKYWRTVGLKPLPYGGRRITLKEKNLEKMAN